MSFSRLLDLRKEESRVVRHVKPSRCGEASRKPRARSRARTSALAQGFLPIDLPGGVVPFLTNTILSALGSVGLSAANSAIGRATNKAACGDGIYRTGDRLTHGSGLYWTENELGEGIFPALMNKKEKTVVEIPRVVGGLEKLGVIEKGSLSGTINEMEGQRDGFIGTLLATLAGYLLPALLGKG